MSKTCYVLGFVFQEEHGAWLIHKHRPEWLANLYNGIGGHLEAGEVPLEAMIRECREETGVQIEDWTQFADIVGTDFEIVVFYTIIPSSVSFTQTTDEELVCADIGDMYEYAQADKLAPHVLPLVFTAATHLELQNFRLKWEYDAEDKKVFDKSVK